MARNVAMFEFTIVARLSGSVAGRGRSDPGRGRRKLWRRLGDRARRSRPSARPGTKMPAASMRTRASMRAAVSRTAISAAIQPPTGRIRSPSLSVRACSLQQVGVQQGQIVDARGANQRLAPSQPGWVGTMVSMPVARWAAIGATAAGSAAAVQGSAREPARREDHHRAAPPGDRGTPSAVLACLGMDDGRSLGRNL